MAGQTITSATLTFYAGNGTSDSPKASETLGLFGYAGSINALLNNQTNVGIFNDLGTGADYGSAIVTPAQASGQISVTLTAAAIAALNAAASNPGDQPRSPSSMTGLTGTVTGSCSKLPDRPGRWIKPPSLAWK